MPAEQSPIEIPHGIEFWVNEDGEPFALLARGDVPPEAFTSQVAVAAAQRDAGLTGNEALYWFEDLGTLKVTQFHLHLEDELFMVCDASAPGADLYTGIRFP